MLPTLSEAPIGPSGDVKIALLKDVVRDGDHYRPATIDDVPSRMTPGPRAQRRHFLEVLRNVGVVMEACRAVHVERPRIQQWRDDDPKFERDYQEALIVGRYQVLDTAVDRALKGAYAPVVDSEGKIVAWVREPSDSALIAIKRAMFPERVKENKT